MRYTTKKIAISFLILVSAIANSQSKKKPTVEKVFYKSGQILRENFISAQKTVDSIKTYHLSGLVSEKFYFNKKGQLDGLGQKISVDGTLMATWLYKKGILLERKDYLKMPFNIKTKPQVDYNYANIRKCDSLLKIYPEGLGIIYEKACSQTYLGENILSEIDFLYLKDTFEKLRASIPQTNQSKITSINQMLANIYGRLSVINGRFENQLLSLEYLFKAVQADPKSNIHLYNLGAAFATKVEDYRLALFYLNEVVKERPNHNFANWVLGHVYLELEEYQKSLECLNIAFKGEGGLYKDGYGNVEGDLRTLRGLVYHKLGKSDLGITNLNKALEINANNSLAHKHLGIIYQDLGNNEKACEYFQKSRELGFETTYYKKSLSAYISKTCIVKKPDVPAVIEQTQNVVEINTEKEVENKPTIENQKTVIIPETAIKELAYIAPNPAIDFVEVFNFDAVNYNYSIYNVAGVEIIKGISKMKTIQVSDLPSGFYILLIEKNGKTERFKLLKN